MTEFRLSLRWLYPNEEVCGYSRPVLQYAYRNADGVILWLDIPSHYESLEDLA